MKACLILKIVVIIALTNCACKEKNDPCPITFETELQQPYDDPVWHPSGNVIGFNHTPIKEIHYYEGYDCPYQADYIYENDSIGFWLINSDGTNMRRVLPFKLDCPSWSPDGKNIAFSYQAQICTMPFNGEQFDTSAIVFLTNSGRNFFPTWSPDGEWIAFDSDFESPSGLKYIWKMRKDGSHKSRVAFTPTLGETRMPYWGTNMTILHRRFTIARSADIFKMDSSGNNVVQLTNSEDYERYPAYSSTCEHICYIAESNKTNGIQLWRINRDGSQPIQLTSEGCRSFSWSPDDEIVYLNFYGDRIDVTKGTLWIMDATGEKKRQLTYNIFKSHTYN